MKNNESFITKNHQKYEDLITRLNALNIKYELLNHSPAKTTQEADQYITGSRGVRTKSMLVRDKKKHFSLIIMDDAKRLDFKHFQEISDQKRLSLAKAPEIEQLFNLEPGIISPFGVMYSQEQAVDIYFDKEMLDNETRLTFHPNENTHTIFLEAQDVMTFIESYGYTYQILKI